MGCQQNSNCRGNVPWNTSLRGEGGGGGGGGGGGLLLRLDYINSEAEALMGCK